MTREKILQSAAVYLFYLGVAVLITWPLATNLSTRLTGFPYGDGHEMARHIWWYTYALRTGQPIFWQPLLGYPDGMEGVLLWAHPQQFFPAWLFAFVMPLPAAANLAILLHMALNGWAMYTLARDRLGGLRAPALLAGVAFMAAPTFQGHLGGGHAGLMVMWPVPLYVLALFKLRDTSRNPAVGATYHVALGRVDHSSLQRFFGRTEIKWSALAVLFFVLSPGGHILQLIYVLLPITAIFALWQVIERDWRGLARTALVSMTGCALLLVFLLPIARSTFNTPAYTDEGGFTRYSADLLSMVSPSFFHPLYSGLEYPRRVLGINLEEGVSYVGIIAGLLALIGVWKFKAARWWLALALVAWIFSLGPLLKLFDQPVRLTIDSYETFITLPWAALQNLPFFSLARTPGRFNFTLALAVAMLAGYGARVLWHQARHASPLRWRLTVILIGAVLFDYQVYWPLPTTPAAIPQAVYDLAEREDVRAVFNIPWGNPVAAKDALYLQTAHRKPLIAGHVTRSTPVSPAKLTLLQDTLDPALLNEVSADIVILHKAYINAEIDSLARIQLGGPHYEDADIALFEVPGSPEKPAFQTVFTPQAQIERRADAYIYAPVSGWVDVSGTLTVNDSPREVVLLLDRQPVHRWHVSASSAFRVPLPVSESAYHTVTLAVEPACPQLHSPLLECQRVAVSNFSISDLSESVESGVKGVQFDRGVTLVESALPSTARDALTVRLLWQFDAPRAENEIRFVHVVSLDGQLAGQMDNPLGVQPAGSQWAEAVNIALEDHLPAGEYRVYAGWYTLPDVTRFPVLSDVEGARDGWALLGSFTLQR